MTKISEFCLLYKTECLKADKNCYFTMKYGKRLLKCQTIYQCMMVDELVKSRNFNGKVKSSLCKAHES